MAHFCMPARAEAERHMTLMFTHKAQAHGILTKGLWKGFSITASAINTGPKALHIKNKAAAIAIFLACVLGSAAADAPVSYGRRGTVWPRRSPAY